MDPPSVRQDMRDRREAEREFATLSTEERFAWWADECSLADLYEPNPRPRRNVRRHMIDLLNNWISTPE
jgi:hypothetical protein